MDNEIRSEDEAFYKYVTGVDSAREGEDQLIERALAIIEGRWVEPMYVMENPDTVKNYLRLKLAALEYEVFAVLFLDNRHRVIDFQEMFRGTVDGASVWPREILKEALKVNAAAVILAHNHPSGVVIPSKADKRITERVSEALALISVRTLDHILVGGVEAYSFSEAGLI